jgi:hypothetical protein
MRCYGGAAFSLIGNILKQQMLVSQIETSYFKQTLDAHALYPLFSTNRTLTSCAGCSTMSACIPGCSPSIKLSIPLKRCNNRTSVYPISVSANCCPMQIRGPPLNGMYVHDFGVQESQRLRVSVREIQKGVRGGLTQARSVLGRRSLSQGQGINPPSFA